MLPFLLILLFSLVIISSLTKVRSLASGHKGSRFLQPLFDINLLFKKGSVYSNTSSSITQIAAPLHLSAIIIAAICIPLGKFPALISFNGDIILFCYLMAISRFILILAALDSGSPLQGLGVSRKIHLSILAEPAFFLLIATLAIFTGEYSFSSIFAQFNNTTSNLIILSIIVGFGLFKLLLLECARMPIENNKSQLELSMIENVMTLDMSGIDLAFIKLASWLKLSIYGTLIANVLIPSNLEGWLVIVLFVVLQQIIILVIGVIESFGTQNKINKNNIYILTLITTGIISFIITYLMANNILPI